MKKNSKDFIDFKHIYNKIFIEAYDFIKIHKDYKNNLPDNFDILLEGLIIIFHENDSTIINKLVHINKDKEIIMKIHKNILNYMLCYADKISKPEKALLRVWMSASADLNKKS